MKILDLLAKLGILRYGAKSAVYTNAKERPIEFMLDDVYNAERDLTGGKSTAKFCTHCGAALQAGEKFCTGCGKAV